MKDIIVKLFRGNMQDVGEMENVQIRQNQPWHEPISEDTFAGLLIVGMMMLFFMVLYIVMLMR